MARWYALIAHHGQANYAFSAVARPERCAQHIAMDKTEGGKPYHEWLKEELAAPGRSQSGLARFLGLDSSAINRLVNGRREVRFREVSQIRTYLDQTGDKQATSNVNEFTNPAQAGELTVIKFASEEDANANAKVFFSQQLWLLRRAYERALLAHVARHFPDDDEAGNSIYILHKDPEITISALHLLGFITAEDKKVLRLYGVIGAAAEAADPAKRFPEQSPEAMVALGMLSDFLGIEAGADPVLIQLRYGQRAAELLEKVWGKIAGEYI